MKPPKIETRKTPREIIATDFKSLDGELPISGGWGYSKEDAVIIDKNDPVVLKGQPFYGVGIERVFVEKRIYEELVIRATGGKFSGIEWKMIKQVLIKDVDREFDFLTFNVTAFPDADWVMPKNERKQNDGVDGEISALMGNMDKIESQKVSFIAEYWFDITSFFRCY